jgi:protein TonB
MKKILLILFLCPALIFSQTDSSSKETVVIPDTFEFVEKPAEFPGGNDALNKYLAKEISYPKEARDSGIQGKVYVKFVIEKDGSIGETIILNKGKNHTSLETETLRVIKQMPNWTPAEHNGKIVRSYYTLPINFTLYDEKISKKKKRKR